jgi:hypothetical protein
MLDEKHPRDGHNGREFGGKIRICLLSLIVSDTQHSQKANKYTIVLDDFSEVVENRDIKGKCGVLKGLI